MPHPFPSPAPQAAGPRAVRPGFAGPVAAVLASLALLSGCGGGDAPPPAVAPQALDCSSLTLSATEALPLAAITVAGAAALGIDEGWRVEAHAASGRVTTARLQPGAGGSLEMAAPVHPDLTPAGGAIELHLRGSDRACAPLPFTVLALPAPTDSDIAAGTTSRALALAAAVRSRTAAGLDAETLRSTPLSQLPPESVPAALMAIALGGAEQFAAEVAALPAGEREAIEALLDQTGLNAALDRLTQAYEGLPAPQAGGAGPRRRMLQAAPPRAASVAPSPAPLAWPDARRRPLAGDFGLCGSLGAVPADKFMLATAEQLSDIIKVSAGLKADLNGPLGRTFKSASAMFGALGLVAPAVGTLGGDVLFLLELATQMRANLYPNALDSLSFDVDKTRIEEDWSALVYGDPVIRWSGAELRATNSGMALDRTFIDGGLNLIGLDGSRAVPEGVTRFADYAAKGEIGKALDQLQKDRGDDGGCWTIDSTVFTAVPVEDDAYYRYLDVVVTGDSIAHDYQTREIMATRLGTSTLELRSRKEAFPGPVVLERKNITVPPKQVRFLPGTVNRVAEPGALAEVRFRLDDTRHGERDRVTVEVTDRDGQAIAIADHVVESEWLHALRVPTPTDRARFPLSVRVTSTSLALEPSDPPRRGVQSIVVDEGLEITPRDVCLAHGGSQAFTAAYTGADPAPDVRWEIVAGGGTLGSPSGLGVTYTAPASDGQVTLRASLAADDRIGDEVTFQVGRCLGMAVYYQHAAQVSFPGRDAGCQADEAGIQERLDSTFDRMPAELDQPTPVSDFWFGRRSDVQFDPVPSGTAIRGMGPLLDCVDEAYRGRATLDASLAATADGSRLDVAIDAAAENECRVSGATGQEQCSQASADTQWAARYELEVARAGSYRVQLQLDCGRDRPLEALPWNVSLTVMRFRPDGTMVLTHADPQRAFLPSSRNFACQDAASAVRFDQTIAFDAPVTPGTVDRVVVFVVAGQGAMALESDAQGTPGVRDAGAMHGFVQVTRAPD